MKWKNEISTWLRDFRGSWFLSDEHSEERGQFNLKRGDLTIQRQFTEKFEGRMTPDISVNRGGDGKGDIEPRLKYLFLHYKHLNFFIIIISNSG